MFSFLLTVKGWLIGDVITVKNAEFHCASGMLGEDAWIDIDSEDGEEYELSTCTPFARVRTPDEGEKIRVFRNLFFHDGFSTRVIISHWHSVK